MVSGLNLNNTSYDRLIKLRDGLKTIEYDNALILDLGVTSGLTKNKAEKLAPVVAEASMGFLGSITVKRGNVNVNINRYPHIATLSCQLAGWNIPVQSGNALGSGPARILAKKPRNIIESVGYYEESKKAALVVETESIPSQEAVRTVLKKTMAKNLIVAAFKGRSYVGLVNVLARVVEMAFFRLNFLEYDVGRVESASGVVPIPANADAFSANDAIIYAGSVEIRTRGWDETLSDRITSAASKSYGERFETIYEQAGGDFYNIDPAVFAPAQVEITDTTSSKQYTLGETSRIP